MKQQTTTDYNIKTFTQYHKYFRCVLKIEKVFFFVEGNLPIFYDFD